MVDKLNTSGNLLNWIIGGIFALTAVILLIKIFLHKDAAEKIEKIENVTISEIKS